MASALFSQPTRTGHSSSYINGSPVQFKAGRLFRDGTTNWVKADPRKGLIFMRQADDGLMHFYWKDRRSHQIEEDLIIFPEDAEFIKCQQSEDRVYLLKFKSSSQRLFFWMQGSNLDRDAEACRRVNRLLNATVYPSESDHHAAGASEDAAMPGLVDEAALTDMARSVDHLLGTSHHHHHHGRDAGAETPTPRGYGEAQAEPTDLDSDDNASAKATVGSTTTSVVESVAGTAPSGSAAALAARSSAAAAARSRDQSASWAHLREVMTNLKVPDHESPSGGSRGAGGAHSSTDDVDLPDVLSPETLNTLLADPEVCTALFPYLPESPGAEAPASGRGSSATPTPSTPHQRSPQEVRQIVRSPPFQHALRSLSYALQTGQLGPLIQQLGLPHDASYSVESFLRAIENQVKQESGTNQSSSQQSDNMDEDL
ncbi:hypothetical protein H4R33_006432 [Dimargaris cristalligena]|nr:hypothetical protein H4R33_006432 [Dimargaris cristalligena]